MAIIPTVINETMKRKIVEYRTNVLVLPKSREALLKVLARRHKYMRLKYKMLKGVKK